MTRRFNVCGLNHDAIDMISIRAGEQGLEAILELRLDRDRPPALPTYSGTVVVQDREAAHG